MQHDKHKPNILFLCTGNSCRSQMAEGWARHLHGDSLTAYSAGVQPTVLNPDAVRAMSEAGVDISDQRSKHLDDLKGVSFDHVIAVCDDAFESCPVFPGQMKVIRRAFDDPPRLAKDAAGDDERLAPYRRVRDEIRAMIESLPEFLEHVY